MDLFAERVRELLDYDPETGIFVWRYRADASRTRNTRFAGKRAGSLMATGRRVISIDKTLHYAARLAWLYVTGEWPGDYEMDHKNMNKGDDRFCNLRLATHGQNTYNRGPKSTNPIGVKGVRWFKRDCKWHARIRIHGRERHLGYFDDLEDAAAAYRAAAKLYHGEFARTERGAL